MCEKCVYFLNGTFFWPNKKIWLCHSLDNYISKGNSQPDFLISLPCKCYLNFRELRSIVTLNRRDISFPLFVCCWHVLTSTPTTTTSASSGASGSTTTTAAAMAPQPPPQTQQRQLGSRHRCVSSHKSLFLHYAQNTRTATGTGTATTTTLGKHHTTNASHDNAAWPTSFNMGFF